MLGKTIGNFGDIVGKSSNFREFFFVLASYDGHTSLKP